jgi:hypothetical protein
MQITLELSKVEGALLHALAPRGNARKGDNYMETTAKNLLLAGMQREAKLRRITGDQIGVTALVEAVERRKQVR